MLPLILLLLFSLISLLKLSQLVVTSSVKLIRFLKLEELAIGFILIALSTSLPEFAISFSAINIRNAEISIGNLIGSNMANLALILGIISSIYPLRIKRKNFEKLMGMLFFSSLIPLLLLYFGEINEIFGIFLILIFFYFVNVVLEKKIILTFPSLRKDFLERLSELYTFLKSLIILCLSLIGVMFFSALIVVFASEIADWLKITHTFFGATFLAISTSFPEFSIAFLSAKKKRFNLALGNLIGSCLTNLTLILGILLLFAPFKINIQLFSTSLFFVIFCTLVTWYFLITKRMIERKEGIFLIFLYIIFLMFTSGMQIFLIEFFKL